MVRPYVILCALAAATALCAGGASPTEGEFLLSGGYCYVVNAGSLGIDQSVTVCPPID